jgi:broad specificity phosphatase PhoE
MIHVKTLPSESIHAMPDRNKMQDRLTARLTLISHAPLRSQRRAAFPLDESLEAREAARVAALRWQAPRAQHVLTGPELSTQQTAQALGLAAAVAPELRDCDYGTWRGHEFDELHSANPESILAWLTDPSAAPHGGESVMSLIERVGRWLDGRSTQGHTIAITHPAVIRSAVVCALHAPHQAFWRIDIAPLSLTDIRFRGTVRTLRSVGCPLHTSLEEPTPDEIS